MIIKFNGKVNRSAPQIGLALSGGGLRGVAHIGVLKVLQENNIPISMISGTSAGSIIAALYASGYSASYLENLAKAIDIRKLLDLKVTVSDLVRHSIKWAMTGRFKFWSILPYGLIKGAKIEKFLYHLLHDNTVRDTKIPIAITAVDAISGDTAFFLSPLKRSNEILNARYFYSTTLVDAVRASISIPGVVYPKKYRGMILVDGGVKNNLPTDILKYMGADIIFAVDLGYSGEPNYGISSAADIILQSMDIMGREITLLKGEKYADVIIRPLVHDISFAAVDRIPLCIKRGEDAAQRALEAIQKIL